MLSRTSFRFSADGTHVTCLAAPRPNRWHVESWELPDGEPYVHDRLTVRGPTSQVLPLDDGGVLLCQPLPDARGHELTRSGARTGVRPLATVPTLGFRIFEHPSPDVHAVAVTTDTEPELTSTLWLVRDAVPALQRVCTLPGLLAGGSWLDAHGTRLGLNQANQGTLTAVVLDLDSGVVTPAFPGQPNVRLLLASPTTELLVVGDESGALGWADPGGAVTWSRALDDHLNAFPVAAAPDGERVVLRYETGALSGLATYRPHTDDVVDLGLPPGSVGATGSWVGDTLHVPFASPDRPAGLVAVRPDAVVTVERAAGADGDEVTPRLDSFPGPAGPVDAVLYRDWRTAPSVVVALHGGPDSSWRLEHDPVLAQLASDGTAIVAVNPRGSRGYRGAHEALRDGWGGADLADVHAVGSTIARERGGPVALFGVSYGAFLALLALGTRPDPWTRAAAVAPFLSGPRLYADAGTRVRALVDRLGGRTVYTDELGPRDVAQLATRITTPLLVLHGVRDDVVPVEHSRELDARLRAADAPVTYLELVEAGHDPFAGRDADAVMTRIRDFLAGATAPTGGIEHHHGSRGGQCLAQVRR